MHVHVHMYTDSVLKMGRVYAYVVLTDVSVDILIDSQSIVSQ